VFSPSQKKACFKLGGNPAQEPLEFMGAGEACFVKTRIDSLEKGGV